MQIERTVASNLSTGDVVAVTDLAGWWLITATAENSGRLLLTLSGVNSHQQVEIDLDRDSAVRRGEPGSLHTPDEFLGMTTDHAQAWAFALGWTLREFPSSGEVGFTDDIGQNRVTVWTDSTGTVTRAELF